MNTPKCPDCSNGLQVRRVPSKLYACGFIDEGFRCPTCGGSERIPPVSDGKSAACGEREVA